MTLAGRNPLWAIGCLFLLGNAISFAQGVSSSNPPELIVQSGHSAKVVSVIFSPDGKKLYVANGRSNSVSVIDTVKNIKLRDVNVGTLPWGVVIK